MDQIEYNVERSRYVEILEHKLGFTLDETQRLLVLHAYGEGWLASSRRLLPLTEKAVELAREASNAR